MGHNASFQSVGASLRAGLFLNVNWAKRTSFQFELDYSYMKSPELVVSNLVIPILFQFKFRRDARVNPYLEIGIANILGLETKPIDRVFNYDELIWFDQSGNTTYEPRSEYLAPSATISPAFLCGAGVEFLLNSGNILRLNLRYEFVGEYNDFDIGNDPYMSSRSTIAYNNFVLKAALGF